MSCIICNKPADKAHIKSKGSGGGMEKENILDLCRLHHRLQHDKGWSYMMDRYPEIKEELNKKGWEINNLFGIPKLRRKE